MKFQAGKIGWGLPQSPTLKSLDSNLLSERSNETYLRDGGGGVGWWLPMDDAKVCLTHTLYFQGLQQCSAHEGCSVTVFRHQ